MFQYGEGDILSPQAPKVILLQQSPQTPIFFLLGAALDGVIPFILFLVFFTEVLVSGISEFPQLMHHLGIFSPQK